MTPKEQPDRFSLLQHSRNSNIRFSQPSYFYWVASVFFAALLVCFYIHYVVAFGVDVPYWDDWQLLDLVRAIYSGQAKWWTLATSKHNEHLVGAAFLIEALQLLLTGFDYKLQLLTGTVLQVATFAFLSASVWRLVPSHKRPFWFAISCLIWFSLAQYKNLLWPFQTAWFIVSLLLSVTLGSLKLAADAHEAEEGGRGIWFGIAVLASIFASFTLLHGLAIWVAGAFYLAGRRSFGVWATLENSLFRRWLLSALLGSGLTAYVWFHTDGGASPANGAFSLGTFTQILIGIHGDFFGDLGLGSLLALGSVMLCLTALAVAQVLLSRQKALYALPLSLITFGLLFVVMVAFGRAQFGVGPASDSHYTAYLVLTYFGVLTIFFTEDDTLPDLFPSRRAASIFCGAIALASFTSDYDAVLHGIEWRSDQGVNAALLLKYNEEPDFVIARTLFGDPAMVRRNAEFLQVHHFGGFGDQNSIPVSVGEYAIMPKTLVALKARHPESGNAIERAWQVYEVGNDLRMIFNPEAEDFAKRFIAWCAQSSQPTGDHYLHQYLAPFAADYTALVKDDL